LRNFAALQQSQGAGAGILVEIGPTVCNGSQVPVAAFAAPGTAAQVKKDFNEGRA
jgi:hypothetical protein